MPMKAIEIPFEQLLLSLLPVFLVIGLFFKLKMNWRELGVALFRMILQLIAVGYFLTFLFSRDSSLTVLLLLMVMMGLSSWITLRSVKSKRRSLYAKAMIAQFLGATPALFWNVLFVLPGGDWHEVRILIPLAGMVYANSMNTMSLAAERFAAELELCQPEDAMRKALTAAFIPHINMLMAVGLVSLPGLMTGQILSGVDPLVAVRYQIVIITMIFCGSGLSSFLFLWRWKRSLNQTPPSGSIAKFSS